jgi:hypothetical protein
MITYDEATTVLYTVLCTKSYAPAGYYTVVQYKSDPLYSVQDTEFTLDPILNHPKFIRTHIGPAA